MASVEPIIVVLGPFGGGTSAVAGVLHHLGVFMGSGFDLTYRGPYETWEESQLGALCRNAFTTPFGQLQMDAGTVQKKLRGWADDHRRAARAAERRPGVKQPILCAAIDFIDKTWGPMIPVVVDRPTEKVVASLNRLGWWTDEQERVDSTAHLITARDSALAGVAAIRVDFEELRTAPEAVIRRLAHELGLEVTADQVHTAARSVARPADTATRDEDPYRHIIDLLLAEVERNPGDAWSVFRLAATCFDSRDFANARKWYARRAAMGGSGEEIYYALYRVAESMSQLGEPWPDVMDAYLRAWELRPTRAEPLYAIAGRYRADGSYRLGYLFARLAAEIPLPEEDTFFDTAVYSWRAADEQATCAFYIGKQAEAFTLCRQLLGRADIPENDRQRIAKNRDFSVPAMIAAASLYPDALVHGLIAGPPDAAVTVTLLAGPDRDSTEQMLNSFLNCCTDVSRAGRFLMAAGGLPTRDRTGLSERYPFLEFAGCGTGDRPGTRLASLREQIGGRFWLDLGEDWRFFGPENLLTRMIAVLEADAQVFQVGINFADAAELTGASAAERTVRRTPETGRYVLADTVAGGPAMFDTTRLDKTGGVDPDSPDPLAELGQRAAAVGLLTASLDEVLCVAVHGSGNG